MFSVFNPYFWNVDRNVLSVLLCCWIETLLSACMLKHNGDQYFHTSHEPLPLACLQIHNYNYICLKMPQASQAPSAVPVHIYYVLYAEKLYWKRLVIIIIYFLTLLFRVCSTAQWCTVAQLKLVMYNCLYRLLYVLHFNNRFVCMWNAWKVMLT